MSRFTYVRALGGAVLRWLPLVVVSLLIGIVVCYGHAFGFKYGGYEGALLNRSTYELWLSWRDELPEDAPVEVRVSWDDETAALEAIVQAESTRDFYRAISDYYWLSVQTLNSEGRTAEALEDRAAATLTGLLADMDNPPGEYAEVSDLPALLYMATMMGSAPFVMLLFPCCMVAARVSGLRSRYRLLGRVPVSAGMDVLCGCLATVTCSAVYCATLWLPAFVLAAVGNGVGDVAYPVVFVQSGEVVATTVAGVLLRAAALVCLISLVLGAAGELVRVFADNAVVCGAACGVLLVASLYVPSMALSSTIKLLLPITYFDFSRIAGYSSPTVGGDVSVVVGADFGIGCAVLLCWGAALCVLSAVVAWIKRRRAMACSR